MKIKIEIILVKPPKDPEKYDTSETFETSFEGNNKDYLDIIAKVIPLIPTGETYETIH